MKFLRHDVGVALLAFAIVFLLVLCSHSETAVSTKDKNGRLRDHARLYESRDSKNLY